MRTLNSLPFESTTPEQKPAVNDIAFRYKPNVLCPACREILKLALELHQLRGVQLSEYIGPPMRIGEAGMLCVRPVRVRTVYAAPRLRRLSNVELDGGFHSLACH